MLSRVAVCLLLAGAAVFAQGKPRDDSRLRDLIQEFRAIDPNSVGFGTMRSRKLAVLDQIAQTDRLAAAAFLCSVARSPVYTDLLEDLLPLLARRYPDATAAESVFMEHMGADDPFRGVARSFLAQFNAKRGRDAWFKSLFREGSVEDRFLAVECLGSMGSKETLTLVEALMADVTWKPSGKICFQTLARALADFEGSQAAQLLLLMMHDPRFSAEDQGALREATRTWRQPDLEAHIQMSALADPDAEQRKKMARFLGDAGIEAGRAPLTFLARRAEEPADVRAAAVAALGGLRIARGDLARLISSFLSDAEQEVRVAALGGLVRLRVRQSYEIVVDQLGGPLDGPARDLLAVAEHLPRETAWRSWLRGADLPDGT